MITPGRHKFDLTWGGLPDHEMVQEKSADAIVGTGNELSERGRGLTR